MTTHRKIILLFVLVIIHIGHAQQKLNIQLETAVTFSNKNILPLWLYSNEWGKYLNTGDFNGMFYAGANYKLLEKESFSLNIGGGLVVNSDINKSILHEAFVNGHIWFVDYSIGKETRSWVAYDDHLSSGNYLISHNVRPIPKATIGIQNYLPLGFTKNWLEIKGGISQGVLADDRGDRSNSANNVLLHEKWAYGRLGNTQVQPYLGIVHSALFGGTRPNGTKIPIDFWATFLAEGSSKLGGGEETNAAGAHMGFWDFGVYYNTDNLDVQLYWQKPFADASGLKLRNGENKDYIIGVLLYPKELKWLKGISLEIIKTDVQSDYGIPDPLYPVDYNGHKKGSIIWKKDIETDFDSFMYEVFGETRTGWTWEEVDRYMQVEMNEGYKFGGRDDYMNNGSYYSGWTYHDESMGTPLYHTIEAANNYHSGPWNNHLKFINNRVNAIHLGMEGNVIANLAYRFKTTYTVNYGSYAEEFAYRYSWNRTPDYFFNESKKQMYMMLEARLKLASVKGLEINGAMGYDFGDLYDAVGGRIGLIYRPDF